MVSGLSLVWMSPVGHPSISLTTIAATGRWYLLSPTISLIHVDNVCEAHIFCMEKPTMRGRFLCSAVNASTKKIADCYCENDLKFKIPEEYMPNFNL